MSEEEKKNLISLHEATKYCSYSQEYLSLRARQGELKSIKIGRNWLTKKEWVEEYLAKNGKNGKAKPQLQTLSEVQPQPVAAQKESAPSESPYLSLFEATKYCSYSQEYLSLRARQGELKSIKIGRNWLTKKEWVEEYLAKVGNGFKKQPIQPQPISPQVSFQQAPQIREVVPAEKEVPVPVNLPIGDFVFRPYIPALPGLRLSFAFSFGVMLIIAGAFFGQGNLQSSYQDFSSITEKTGDAIYQNFNSGLATLRQGAEEAKESSDSFFGKAANNANIVFSTAYNRGKNSVLSVGRGISDFVDTVGTANQIVVGGIIDLPGRSFSVVSQDIKNIARLQAFDIGNAIGNAAEQMALGVKNTSRKIKTAFFDITNNIAQNTVESGQESIYNIRQMISRATYNTINGVQQSAHNIKNFSFAFYNKTREGVTKVKTSLYGFGNFIVRPYQSVHYLLTHLPEITKALLAREANQQRQLEALEVELGKIKKSGIATKEIIKEIRVVQITKDEPTQEITKQYFLIEADDETLIDLKSQMAEFASWRTDIANLKAITQKLQFAPAYTYAPSAPIYIGSSGIQVGGNANFASLGVSGEAGVRNLGVGKSATIGTDSSDKLTVNATATFGPSASFQNGLTAGSNALTIAETGNLTTSGAITATGNISTAGNLVAGSQLKILEGGASPTKYTIIQGGDQTDDITYTLPTGQGVAGTFLQNDGVGTLSWASVTLTSYVPYTGAAQNVQLGSYSLTTTGTVSAGNLTVGTLELTTGNITDSSGAISFGSTNLSTTGTVTFGTLSLTSPLALAYGGTGLSSVTPYAIIAGGTTATNALQQVAGLGIAGQVLTSNGAGALPTWQSTTVSANIALSNLASVAINTALLPGTAGALDFGSATKPWADIYLAGTSATPATNNFKLTGISTSGTRVLTLPDTSGTITLGTGVNTQLAYWSGTNTLTSSVNLTFDGTTLTAGNFNTIGTVTSGTLSIGALGISNGSISTTGSITTTGTGTFGTLKDTGLTSGRVTYATTGGQLTDSANLTFSGSTLTVGTALALASGSIIDSSGAISFSSNNLTTTGTVTSGIVSATSIGTVNLSVGGLSGMLKASGGTVAAAISGTDYVIPSTLNSYVPYTGATTAVDLGSQNLTTTGTGTIGTVKIGSATGVSATATNGILTLAGLKGSGNNENLTFDFETTANTVAIGTGTGVTTLSLGSISLQTTGTVTAGTLSVGTGALGSLIVPYIYPATNSTTAFQIRAANATTSVLNVDTTNSYVGIGTTAPGANLHITKDDATTNSVLQLLRIDRTTTGTAENGIGGEIGYYLERGDGTNFKAGSLQFVGETVVGNNSAARFVVNVNDVNNVQQEAFRINAAGALGLGATPYVGARLQVNGSIYFLTSNDVILNPTGNAFTFNTLGTNKLKLSAAGGLSLGNSYVATDPGAGNMIIAGKVGIGTTTPRTQLDVLSISGAQLRLTYTDNSVYTAFTTNSAGNLTIAPSGNSIALGSAGLTTTGTVSGGNFNTTGTVTGGTLSIGTLSIGSGNYAVNITQTGNNKRGINISESASTDGDTAYGVVTTGTTGTGSVNTARNMYNFYGSLTVGGTNAMDRAYGYGLYNSIITSGSSVRSYGTYNNFSISDASDGLNYGLYNNFALTTGGSTSNYGVYNNAVMAANGMPTYGVYNNFSTSYAGGTNLYGLYNAFTNSGGYAYIYGLYQSFSTTGDQQNVYGNYTAISTGGTSVTQTVYGDYLAIKASHVGDLINGLYVDDNGSGTINDPTQFQTGVYLDWTYAGTDANSKKWALYNASSNTTSGKVFLGIDSVKTYFGTGFDAAIWYDGSNLYIDPKQVGTGAVNLNGGSLTTTGTITAGTLSVGTLGISSGTLNNGSGTITINSATRTNAAVGINVAPDSNNLVTGTLTSTAANTTNYLIKGILNSSGGSNNDSSPYVYGYYLDMNISGSVNYDGGPAIQNVYGTYIDVASTAGVGNTQMGYHRLWGEYITVTEAGTIGTGAADELYVYGSQIVVYSKQANYTETYGINLTVGGNVSTSGIKYGIYLSLTGTSSANYGLYMSTDGYANAGVDYGIFISSDLETTDYAIYVSSGKSYFQTAYVYTLGANSTVHVCRNGTTYQLTTCSADISEYAPATDDIETGDIVAVSKDKTNPTEDASAPFILEKSSAKYQQNIIGVIADIVAGASLGEKKAEHYKPLVLVGRVPAKVSIENGPIEPGDWLTSSSAPGVAMKSTEMGSVIGKALEPYNQEGIGSIIVFVNIGWYSGSITSGGIAGDGQVMGVENTSLAQAVKDILTSIGITIDNGIAYIKELAVDKLTAKVAKINTLEMVDQVTGDIYCTWIENGDWKKVRGECSTIEFPNQQQVTPPSEPEPAPTPETPVPETPAPEVPVPETPIPEQPQPQPEPEPPVVPEPQPQPEPVVTLPDVPGIETTTPNN